MQIDINNKTKSKINISLVKRNIIQFLSFAKSRKIINQKIENVEISVVFVGDKIIRKLNKIYRNKDKITDVLSFEEDGEFLENDNSVSLGEIIIDFAQIKRQSKNFSNTTDKEMIYILIHGLLHLLGYEDKTEEGRKKMDSLSREYFKKNK